MSVTDGISRSVDLASRTSASERADRLRLESASVERAATRGQAARARDRRRTPRSDDPIVATLSTVIVILSVIACAQTLFLQ